MLDEDYPTTYDLTGEDAPVPAYYPARNEQTCPWCYEEAYRLDALQCDDGEVEMVCPTCWREYDEWLRTNKGYGAW